MAGFSGRGNCYADIGAEYLAGRLTGHPGVLEQKYGGLFESLLKVGRPAAHWSSWQGSAS
jgi:hypothetical protein